MPSTQYIRRPTSSYARAYGAQQPALRVMEGLQSRHRDLKAIYQAPTEEAGQQALERSLRPGTVAILR